MVKCLLATPFRLLEKVRNFISGSSCILLFWKTNCKAKLWMLHKEDCANLIKCSGVFSMGICAFAPHLSKSLGQFAH